MSPGATFADGYIWMSAVNVSGFNITSALQHLNFSQTQGSASGMTFHDPYDGRQTVRVPVVASPEPLAPGTIQTKAFTPRSNITVEPYDEPKDPPWNWLMNVEIMIPDEWLAYLGPYPSCSALRVVVAVKLPAAGNWVDVGTQTFDVSNFLQLSSFVRASLTGDRTAQRTAMFTAIGTYVTRAARRSININWGLIRTTNSGFNPGEWGVTVRMYLSGMQPYLDLKWPQPDEESLDSMSDLSSLEVVELESERGSESA